ncbi:hypothetical protein SAMD00019534_092750 [Acytostelium subglobosum LB1]|uniref:hypothetical protein n=1 Tax=Acytostelium subglobosum LB1 TaxID=1410327 RepID=UPI000644D708|nr:hypothetical protein SAMD00019534_092750 [Acytostelium subglobosum LB1]GAM26100.1 hypothetical protein SAMD00019534_092750 [Acytostelium subglobosum LB1]|eukprot:XP_012751143.1 hypothetical protein SAMD00019534_092750 [Acytostelium subglobosum LB1]
MAVVYQYTSPYFWGATSPSSSQFPLPSTPAVATASKLPPSPDHFHNSSSNNNAFQFPMMHHQMASAHHHHHPLQQMPHSSIHHSPPPPHHIFSPFALSPSASASSMGSPTSVLHSSTSSASDALEQAHQFSPPNLSTKRQYSLDDLANEEHAYLEAEGYSYDEEDPSDTDDEEYQLQMEELKSFLKPFVQQILESNHSKSIRTFLIDCIKEYITVKDFLTKVNLCCNENNIGHIYQAMIQLLIKVDGDVKMVSYMADCGVEESDLEFVKELDLTNNNAEVVKKKRERKRESISRGLRSPPNKWTKEESQNLIRLVTENGDKQWKKIAAKLGGGKTGAQCAQHWKRVLSPEIKKGSWDEDEEMLLFSLVQKHGQSWKNVAIEIKTRTDIQCRYQYFKATTSRQTPWSATELEILSKKIEQILINNYEIGSFQQVAKHLARAKCTKIPRTALECKVKWSEICACYQGRPPVGFYQ